MAACVALLLGGGCFLKVSQNQQQLFELNIDALTRGETVLWQGEGGTMFGYFMMEDHAYCKDSNGKMLSAIVCYDCISCSETNAGNKCYTHHCNGSLQKHLYLDFTD